ncbi:hypothetical protein AJ80_00704 [Polytolypa hystricis UAMH7299]|uniref:DNA polymerase alpha subunit B n=1 Tax=Polytolypa hystricis (strain UAMH7299) TaxID=1447883 RepID=A0A2B7Z367_POLH7|nr:hypothetical protein AJ80_00704 [Polytolypa hystricis UAMH7299]
MEDTVEELNDVFARSCPSGLPNDVLGELQSILRLHSTTPQELFYKWESYCMKMGAEETVLDLATARGLKKDIQDTLERESRGKNHLRGSEKKSTMSATPRAIANNHDMFGMLEDLVPSTPHRRAAAGANGSGTKRKAAFDTPSMSKSTRAEGSSPGGVRTPQRPSNGDLTQPTPFSERQSSGQVLETLNSHLPMPSAPLAPFPEPRIRPTANTDLKKFAYRPMAMRLSEASEVLDDRIDEFMEIIRKHHGLADNAFGNAANQSTKEIIAVGRIASDSLEGKLNTASLVLEMSRRWGAGLRVPLKVDALPSVQFFPGQVVALRGINASKEYFSVLEVLSVPLLPPAASTPVVLQSVNDRLEGGDINQPLNYIIASGPYTADDNLDFEPLRALCEKAASECADSVILMGPFLDIEHPLLASGDFDLPDVKGVDPDTSTLSTLFRHSISGPIHQLAAAVPSITILLLPSVRDAVSKHVSFPQDLLPRRELGLPKQARVLPNPVTVSLNETVFGLCSHDILYELRREEVLGGKPVESSLLTRLPKYLIQQRHFNPIFPPSARENLPKSGAEGGLATGAMVDVGYLKLGEWWKVCPDILITPSMLPPFVKVVENVLVINPGTLSKRKAPGTFAQMGLHPRTISDDEAEKNQLEHKIYDRARADIVKI